MIKLSVVLDILKIGLIRYFDFLLSDKKAKLWDLRFFVVVMRNWLKSKVE